MRVRSCLSAIVLAMVCTSAAMAEQIKNPEYEAWAKFKVGAMSKVEGKSVAMGNESKNVVTTKLVELTADKAVIETVMEMEAMGNKMAMPAQKREIKAMIEKPAATAAPDAAGKTDAKSSEETVQVAGKSIKCKVIEADVEANGMKSHSKTWTSDEVPGGTVKMESHSTAPVESTTTMALVEFSTGG